MNRSIFIAIAVLLIGASVPAQAATVNRPSWSARQKARARFLSLRLTDPNFAAGYKAVQEQFAVPAKRDQAIRDVAFTALTGALTTAAATSALTQDAKSALVVGAVGGVAGAVTAWFSGKAAVASVREARSTAQWARVYTVQQFAGEKLLSASDRAIFERAGWVPTRELSR